MIDPRVASGLRDIPPSTAIHRERMLRSFRSTFASFGFLPIETPHIERMEVLTGKGAGSDEVLRQIFEVTNKGGTPGELALRFDLTVPLARFMAKHVDEIGVPFKRYAIGSVFRGERPAKGRFREFTQCDFDTVGTESVIADAEIVQVIHAALSAAGAPEFTITINNRRVLDGLLESIELTSAKELVLRGLDRIDKVGREKAAEYIASAVGDTAKVDRVLEFARRGKGGIDVLAVAEVEIGENQTAAEGFANLRAVFAQLDRAGVSRNRVKIDLGLARGLDYYTGIVFETAINGWEKFGSVASGGRYDNLASLYTSRRLPGVGASIGLDRLLALMEEAGLLEKTSTTAPVLIANFPGCDPANLVSLASRLRAAGIGVEVFPDALPLGKQLGYGSSRGHRVALIIGPDEQSKQVFNLRDLATRQERKSIPEAELEATVRGVLDGAGSV